MGFRHVIAVFILSSTMMAYIGRINLSTAIVAMVHNGPKNHSSQNIINDVCPNTNMDSNKKKYSNNNITISSSVKYFDWDQKTQGIILGAFFYGYFFFQIIHGRLVESFGPRILCTIGLLSSGIINLLTPILSEYKAALIASRVILGAFQASIFPSCYALTSRWIPDNERSTVHSMFFIGSNSGVILASTIAGNLSKYGFAGGWPSVFYLSGIIIIIFSIIYFLIVRDEPSTHWMISDEEIFYINTNIKHNDKSRNDGRQSVPWHKILTSKTVWAAAFTHFTMVWSLTVAVLKLPDYMHHVLRIPLEKNGMYTSLMYLAECLSLFTSGLIADRIIKSNRYKKTNVRKIFQSFTQFGGSACLFLIPWANCDTNLFLMVMISTMLFNGQQSGGIIPLSSDMSNKFSAIIFSVFNMIAMTNGFICPLVVGYILDYDPYHIKHQWWIVMYITAALRIAGGLVFTLFISAEPRNWDIQEKSEK